MSKDQEPLVTCTQAAKLLGVSTSYLSAIRRAMGLSSRYFFASEIRKFLRSHPDFRMCDAYHGRGCQCSDCLTWRTLRDERRAQAERRVLPQDEVSNVSSPSADSPTPVAPDAGRVVAEPEPPPPAPTPAVEVSPTTPPQTPSASCPSTESRASLLPDYAWLVDAPFPPLPVQTPPPPPAQTPAVEVPPTTPPQTPVAGDSPTVPVGVGASHLAQTLHQLIQEYRLTCKEIVRRTEAKGHRLSSSYLSRVLNGRQVFMSKPDLTLLAQGISLDPRDHFALCRARLLDECPPAFLDRVRIVCPLDLPEGEKAHPFARLSPRGRAAVRYWIGKRPTEFEALVVALAGGVAAPEPDAPVRHLATTLALLMERNRVEVQKLGRRSTGGGRRLTASYVSRLVNGRQTWAAATDLQVLVEGVSADPVEQAELVRARLYDECPPFAFPLVRVALAEEDRSDEALLRQLSARGRKALLHILHQATHPEPVFVALAQFAGWNCRSRRANGSSSNIERDPFAVRRPTSSGSTLTTNSIQFAEPDDPNHSEIIEHLYLQNRP